MYAFRSLSVPLTDAPVAPVANKLVARCAPYNSRVDFSSETADGLVLCPSDMDASNFIIDSKGTVFAIDFGRTCYMPPSFVSYSLEVSWDPFTRLVAYLIQYPKSVNLETMLVVVGFLVISGNNSLGK